MGNPDDFLVDDLDQLVGLIADADPEHKLIRSASLDPDEVNLPGVWVRFDGLQRTLGGLIVKTTLYLIVEDAGVKRTLGRLAAMLNVVRPALPGPAGTATRAGLILPGSQTPMPALAVPFEMLTTNPDEE